MVGDLLGFDPLKFVTEIVVVILVVLLLIFAWKYQKRVCQALTGDDRIHCTIIDVIWEGVFHCCGTCNGDWTRYITRAACCCCPMSLRKKYGGMNLIRKIGEVLGFTTITIELRNVVVGDLPFDYRADFYVSVECHQNPPMVSSLAEEKHPKVVHFPEVFTVRLCRSLLEQSVVIRVYELNTFGHNELCNCHINAMQVLDWSEDRDPNEKLKRFQMKPVDPGVERETPPWILVEFDQPTEARDLEHFHGGVSTVRTAPVIGEAYRDVSVATFKHQYTLLDPSGHAIQEPMEEDLQEIQCLGRIVANVYSLLMFILFWYILGYCGFRFYVWSCYRQYKWITMAKLHNYEFPVSTDNMRALVDACTQKFEGTGVHDGIPCRPSTEEILDNCISDEDGGHFPAEQPRPRAFAVIIKRYTGFEVEGIPCYMGVCKMRNHLVNYDPFILPTIAALLIAACGMRWCLNSYIRRRKRQRQNEQAEATKRMQKERLTARRLTA